MCNTCCCCRYRYKKNKRKINIIQIIQSPDKKENLIFIYQNEEIYVFAKDYQDKELLTRQEAIRIINFYIDKFHWIKLLF